MSLSSVFGMMIKVHQVDLFKTIGDNIAGREDGSEKPSLPLPASVNTPAQAPGAPSNVPAKADVPANIPAGIAAADQQPLDALQDSADFGLPRFKGPTANALALAGLRPPTQLPKGDATPKASQSMATLADGFRKLLGGESGADRLSERIPTQLLATSGLDISSLHHTTPTDHTLDPGLAARLAMGETSGNAETLAAMEPADVGHDSLASLAVANQRPTPELPKPRIERPDLGALIGNMLAQEDPDRLTLSFGTRPVIATGGNADVDDGRGDEPPATDQRTSEPAKSADIPAERPVAQKTTLDDAAGRQAPAGDKSLRPDEAKSPRPPEAAVSRQDEPSQTGETRKSAENPGALPLADRINQNDLGPLNAPDQAVSGFVELAVGGAILNAAMIPGWPPPRAFATNMIRELIGAETKDAAEQNLLTGLKALGIGKGLMERLRQKLAALKRRLEIMIGLGVLYASIMAVMEAMAEELALIAEEEEDEERGSGHGGRHRILD